MKPRAERGIMPGLGAGSRTALGGERRALIRAVAQEQRSQLLPVGRFSSCPLPSVFLWLAVQDFNIPINISNAVSDQVGEGIFEEVFRTNNLFYMEELLTTQPLCAQGLDALGTWFAE